MSRAKTEFCGDADYLQRYLQERLSEVEESQVIEHIGSCPTCQKTLERLAASEAVWDRLGEHLSFGTPESHETCEFNERDRWVARLKEYLSPTDDPQMMGRLGPYEVCGLIGSGSTGIVLKALEPRLNRYVAIKVLSPAYSSLGASRKRFEREARAVAAVANEHVVPIFAVDEHRGIPFIVMQYISGGSLHQRLQKEGPLETCEVARIGLQVATGLAAAHAQGIVHRDVKPANVLLEHTVDRAMVTDFGLARVTDEATMTRSGTIAGTPQYMSPEQARGEGVDQRTDLFSLGSLLYAACTGRAPFRAETVYGVINRVCEATPRPIRELNPKIEPWLSDFIERLMAKHPDDRLATAEEVSEILAGELAHLQNPSAVPRPRRDWRMRRATPPARYRTAILAIGACLLMATAWLTAPTWSSALAVLGKGRQAKPAPPAAPAEPQPVASPAPQAVPAASPTPGALPPAPTALRPPVAVPGRTHPPVAAPVPPVARVPSTAPGLPPQAPPAPAVVPPAATAPLAPPHAVIQQVSEESFSIDRITTQTVRVALHGFDLSVVGTDDPQVSLTRTVQTTVPPDDEAAIPMRAATVITSIEDGVLQIHNHPDESHDPPESGHLSLRLPREFVLQLNATGGSAEVRDFTGRCEAHVIDGNIALSQVNGDVDARTDRGQIVLDGCQGDVELLATNGDIHAAAIDVDASILASGGDILLGRNPGKVYAQTSGGDIKVDEIVGPLSAHTSDGDVLIKLHESPQVAARVSAAAGDVRIAFVESIGLDVKFEGKLDAPFVPDGIQLGSASSGTLSFNSGSPELNAVSTTGDVTLTYLEEEEDSREGLGGSGSGQGLGGSGSGLGGSGLGGSGSGLGGSGGEIRGLGGSGRGSRRGLGGSGLGGRSVPRASAAVRAKTMGEPRPGALATVLLDENSRMDGYTLYLPVSHDTAEAPFPVIVYLQGAYGVGGEVSDLNNWGLARLLRDESDLSTERNRLLLDSFIVISPHIQEGNYHDEPEVLREILDHVFATYRADPDRVVVTGLSRGGHGSWAFPSILPNTFAAIAPMGGNPSGLQNLSDLDGVGLWVGHNQHDAVVDFGPVADVIDQLEDRDGDSFHTVSSIEDLRGDADALEATRIMTSADSRSHDAWTDVYTSPEFYHWLLKQRRH